MSYSDIRKRREASKVAASKKSLNTAEVVRFEIGGIYGGAVCVDRWRDEKKGTQVGLVNLSEHRQNVKDAHEMGCDFEGYNREFDDFETYFVRTHNGIEYAIDESDLCLVDGDLSEIDVADIETPDKCAFASASKKTGMEPMKVPLKVRAKKPRVPRRRKGNAIVGFV